MTRRAEVPIERLSAELRSLRLRLIRYEQREREAWSADLEAYDQRLMAAAAMLDVTAPPTDTVLPLTATDRAALEEGLADAGLQVRTEPL